MQPIVHLLSVAGSSSQCARCTAMSKRAKEQCGRPALKTSKTQKCQFHGGRGSGPKTPEGRQRVAQAHTVHGRGMATANGGSVKSRRQQSGGHQVIDRAGRLLMPEAMSAPSGEPRMGLSRESGTGPFFLRITLPPTS